MGTTAGANANMSTSKPMAERKHVEASSERDNREELSKLEEVFEFCGDSTIGGAGFPPTAVHNVYHIHHAELFQYKPDFFEVDTGLSQVDAAVGFPDASVIATLISPSAMSKLSPGLLDSRELFIDHLVIETFLISIKIVD